ncbi:MAG: class I SAM-dependent methyltransferase [Nanoarchaeota archaeon]|nr:class I SAM-dependent methyltransferase [Nanoarchaeota archaeon]MBU1029960.1 class I SAM-dependent methyltransferase [Nanoarchaeota archaeon]MBU1850358.1 class I SAM-dependent methyltransferase [Nanoarchaeota archaeon]
MTNQQDTFLASEGNKWFERNKNSLLADEKDLPIRIITLYNLKPKNILEIGCSNGFRLRFLKKKLMCNCTGIEPSEQAIEDGKNKYKDIRFVRGVCSNIPLNKTFDLIIVNFVLHWVDRNNLNKCISEIDRLLKTNGHLILGDFLPDKPTINKYHHLPESDVKTFKQDYANLFVSSKEYIHLAHLSTTHSNLKKLISEKNSNERVSVSLLLKKDLSKVKDD